MSSDSRVYTKGPVFDVLGGDLAGPPVTNPRLDEFEKRLDALYHSFCDLKEQVRKQSEEIMGFRANLGALFDADYKLGERIASLESLRDQWLAASSAEAVCPHEFKAQLMAHIVDGRFRPDLNVCFVCGGGQDSHESPASTSTVNVSNTR